MNIEQILSQAQSADVRLVRFLYCDNGGIIRGKTTPVTRLGQHYSDGIGLTRAMMAMNAFDRLQPVEGTGPVGEVRLVPDLASFTVLPYAPHSAAMYCDQLEYDRSPWGNCPRSFLKRMEARLGERGWHLQAAFEAEFSLAQRRMEESGYVYVPFDETLCFSSIAMALAGPFVDDLHAALEAQGLPVAQYYPELGHGQHEISIRHARALAAADNHLKLRETIRSVALNHGLYASLAPKPFPDQAGNGAHIHFSLWDTEGRNLFYDREGEHGISTLARHFIGGVLAHLPALVAVTCPSVNSYRRLQPQSWSSAYAVYGYDNREAAVRIVSPFWSDVAGSTSLELKAVDNSCNPYLALGCLIAAGLDGIERQLDPGEDLPVDPGALSEEERRQRNIRRLPASLPAAVDELERDALLLEGMGDLLARTFLAVRRSEAAMFAEAGDDEFVQHFYRY
ncbi:MAG: glutamine synthetase family protein [Chloroflexota bacterium]|nr:glutamine synthetase family protein [Chloroflexota bacterium]